MNVLKMNVESMSFLLIIIFSLNAISPVIENRATRNSSILSFEMQPKILYVGGHGEGNYSKIQDAVDNASNGDIIFVYNGIYYEHVKIKKSVILIGESRNETIIDAYNNGTCIEIRANNVLISNFTIRNAGNQPYVSCGIFFTGKNIKILNCNIVNNEYYGIWLCHPENALVSNCKMNYNSWAEIWIASGYNVSVEKCEINGKVISIWGEKIKIKNCNIAHGGIEVGGAFIKIDSCSIHNGEGIIVEYAIFLIIKNCEIYSNSDGILDEFSAFMNVDNCKFYDNKENDIILFSTSFNFFYGNDFILSRKNIFFMDTAFNLWLRNYWKGWFIPLPKPIIGILFAFVLKGMVIPIPWIEFDWLPRIFPFYMRSER